MKNKQPNILSFKEENFIDKSVFIIKKMIDDLLTENETINIALSGGNSPLPLYNELGKFNLSWDRIKFFIVDERCVPENSKENNFNNIKKCFFNYIPSDSFQIVSNSLTYEAAATEYEETIKKYVDTVNGIPKFQLIILGMGLDGHTASLFPNTKALSNTEDLVVLNNVPGLKTNRITMTYPLLINAEKIILLINGEDKRDVFKRAFETELPISKIIPSINLVLN
jgi:6-phosphogluconolactonase